MADFGDPEKDDYRGESRAIGVSPASSSGGDLEKSERSPTRSSDGSIRDDDDSVARHQHRPFQMQRRDTLFIAVPEITNTVSGPELTSTVTRTSVMTSASRPSSFEVDFGPDDPEDPHNWPIWYRALILGFVSFATWTTVLYSTSYTSGMPGMMKEFNEPDETVATLGVTTYMIGLSAGSLILAPVSEIWGREPVYIAALLFFCITTLPCALAKNLAQVQGVRFLSGFAGAAMVSNAPGTVADITHENYRALAISIWSIAPLNGPVTGPLIGGFVSEYLGWRWTNWIVTIISGCACILCATMKETYTPRLLQKKAAKMRKETGDDRWWCRYDQKSKLLETLKVNLTRPLILLATEPILWCFNIYISIIYGILYLCFVAYPLIYTDIRGWSTGITGLSFLGIAGGTILAIVTEPLARKYVNTHKKDPETGRVFPEASISIICVGCLLCPIGQLWFSWTSVPATIHWIWPILSGIPFGAGNSLVFIYSSNYLAGCYGIYAASALAGNAVCRSLMGGTLPLAGPAMYEKMTPRWAGTLLGLVQVALIPIPFIFYKWGDGIRRRSPVIRKLREDQERSEKRAAKVKRQQERRAAIDRGAAVMAEESAEGAPDKETEVSLSRDVNDKESGVSLTQVVNNKEA